MHKILTLLLATCLPVIALTITGGQAQIKTVGGMEKDTWNLWSDGEWGDFVQIKAPGTYQLEIEARGTPAVGVWPRVTVNVDGDPVADLKTESLDLKVFTFELPLPSGIHRITTQYSNDYKTETEDRNFYVKRMTLTAPDGVSEPTLADEAGWKIDWARQETAKQKQVLTDADASIEKLRKEDAVVSVKNAAGEIIPGATVKVELIRHEFLFGCNLFDFDRFHDPIENETYKSRFAGLFNFATTGFYWSDYEPEPGKPNYAYTDKVVAWCQAHKISIKGHPLLWTNPYGIAHWIHGLPTPEQQKQRVTEIVTRYRDSINFWEVVNEPGHDSGINIDQPYAWAHEIAPQAHLIINDSNVLADGFPDFYELLQNSNAHQVPFDGIGIQAHEPEYLRFPLSSVQRILNDYGRLGKDLYITEFTPESSGQPMIKALVPGGVWDEQTQADYAVRFYTVCFANPAVKGITWWDLCDQGSWRKNGGLLRDDLSPKPAYLALTQLIHKKWTTREQGQTDQAGNYSFRGFRGTYAITVEWKGKKTRQEFVLSTAGSKNMQLVLP